MALCKEICINTTSKASELVADILYDVSLQGVSIYDSNDILDLLKNDKCIVVDEKTFIKSDIVKVKAYFPLDDYLYALKYIQEKIENLKKNCPFNLGSLEICIDEVDDSIWWENWKKTYKPIKIGNITIVPSWIEYKNNEPTIKVDPNMAFGSGSHETTRMCIEFLQDMDIEDKKLVDVGTGSGILAILAAKIGCKNIEAYDIDEYAVEAAKKNAKLNNFENVIKIGHSNLLNEVENKFDIVVANITSEILKMLANDLKRYINEKGVVIISGILTMYEDDVINTYKNLGFQILDRKNIGEWVAFKLSL